MGLNTNSIIVVSLMLVCADELALGKGKHIHGYVIRIGFECNKVVSCNVIILGYL